MKITDIITEGLRDPEDNPCWRGYHPVGTKKKAGRTVPNCVPNESVEEDADSGPYIIYATGPRTMGTNDVDLVFKDTRTGKIVAKVVGNNWHPGDQRLKEFLASPGGRDDGGGDNPSGSATYEIYMKQGSPTYVAFGDPNQDSKHEIYGLDCAKNDPPTYYGCHMTLVSRLDWWSFLEKMIGKIMWEDDAIEAGLVDRKHDGDLVFLKQKPNQGISEETSDYARRRDREEKIISGEKAARKRQPAQTSDYARRREQEKKPGVLEAKTLPSMADIDQQFDELESQINDLREKGVNVGRDHPLNKKWQDLVWMKQKILKREQGIQEGSDGTVYPNATVIKSRNGKPVGEIYQSPDGTWGAFHYRADRGADGMDSREDAIDELRFIHSETGRSRPDYTLKGVAEGWKEKVAGAALGAAALGGIGKAIHDNPNITIDNVTYSKAISMPDRADARELRIQTDKNGNKIYTFYYPSGNRGYRPYYYPVEQVKEQGVQEDWQKVNKQDKTAGMSKKAVKAYRREHPGSKLQTAVTTKPSKLKKGSKASKRRKSFCARSAGQKKMHNIDCTKDPDKAICAARRRWNCE